MNIPVFVINLAASADRRLHTQNQLNSLGISYEFIEAVASDDEYLKELLLGRERPVIRNMVLSSRFLLVREIACLLSHMKVCRKIRDEKIEIACILEDDNDYVPDFAKLLDYNTLRTLDYDIIHIGHHNGELDKGAVYTNKHGIPSSRFALGDPITPPYGTYGYIIKRDAAAKLLDCFSLLEKPADHYLGAANALGIKAKLLIPPVVYQNRAFQSTIQIEPHEYINTLMEPLGCLYRTMNKNLPWFQTLRLGVLRTYFYLLQTLHKAGIKKCADAKNVFES